MGREQRFGKQLYTVDVPPAKRFSKRFKAAFKLWAAGGGGCGKGGRCCRGIVVAPQTPCSEVVL